MEWYNNSKQNNFSAHLFCFCVINPDKQGVKKHERKMQKKTDPDRADPVDGVGDDALGEPSGGGTHFLRQDGRRR